MDQEEERNCLVEFSAEAKDDLFAMRLLTLEYWGEHQAKKYDQFVASALRFLCENPGIGAVANRIPGLRIYVLRSPARRSSHGYRAFYRVTETGIEIARLIHTAMNWPDHFEPEQE